MPNAKVLSEKQAIVAELTEKLKTASSGVLVDYKGITVAQDTALRAECRKNELDYAVVKNTLVRFAINNVGLEEMDSVLNGTTSLALSHGDPIAPMRVINKFAKQFNGEKFTIKAGFMDGKVLSLDGSRLWPSCPPRRFCRLRFWAPCWPPSPAWPSSSRPSASRRAALSRPPRLPRKRLPSNSTHIFTNIYLGGYLSWLLRKSMPSSKRLRV